MNVLDVPVVRTRTQARAIKTVCAWCKARYRDKYGWVHDPRAVRFIEDSGVPVSHGICEICQRDWGTG